MVEKNSKVSKDCFYNYLLRYLVAAKVIVTTKFLKYRNTVNA